MVNLCNNDVNSILQALNLLHDQINSLAQQTIDDVIMTVDPASGGIPHGCGVRMTNSLVVDVSLAPNAWAGINIGPYASAGVKITVRGGKKVDVLFAVGEIVNPGSFFYPSFAAPGTFTTSPPGPNVTPVGVIYDTTGYVQGAGGIAKGWINSNFPEPVLP
jgi:hypothetical protein